MSKFTRLSPEKREELVAYLDGELDPSKLEEVESSLSANQVARHDLNQLSRCYDLLNYLPRVTPNPELTQKTLVGIQVRESQVWTAPQVSLGGFRRYLIGGVWFAVLCGTALGAYHFSQSLFLNPVDLLLEDLPVIQNVDRYSEIDGEIEFLKKLQSEQIFDEKSGEVE
jgi:anti-sigma factor RsiW